MEAISKIHKLNKYKSTRKDEVKVTEAERKASKLAGKEITHRILETRPTFCIVGERLTVITENPGPYSVVVIVENKAGDRMAIRYDEIEILCQS